MVITYKEIPPELRRAAADAIRLRRSSLPVPDHIQSLSNEYKRWVRHGGTDPGQSGHKLTHGYIPEKLRKASNIVSLKRRTGGVITDEEARMANEYRRWIKYGGEPPSSSNHESPDVWPLSAYREWVRLIREGVAPGDIPYNIALGYAEHKGMTPKKYTECSPSSTVCGRGCRGQHGDGPKRLRYGPGVARCTVCDRAYVGVPDDTHWCGCCGSSLRRRYVFT